VDCGADYINLADSAGYMLPDDVRARVSALREAIDIPIGFHAHNNLSLAVANSIAAVTEGLPILMPPVVVWVQAREMLRMRFYVRC